MMNVYITANFTLYTYRLLLFFCYAPRRDGPMEIRFNIIIYIYLYYIIIFIFILFFLSNFNIRKYEDNKANAIFLITLLIVIFTFFCKTFFFHISQHLIISNIILHNFFFFNFLFRLDLRGVQKWLSTIQALCYHHHLHHQWHVRWLSSDLQVSHSVKFNQT